jgi:hypothetical protein
VGRLGLAGLTVKIRATTSRASRAIGDQRRCAAAVFLFGVCKSLLERRETHYWELRNLKRYHPYSLRTLKGLRTA